MKAIKTGRLWEEIHNAADVIGRLTLGGVCSRVRTGMATTSYGEWVAEVTVEVLGDLTVTLDPKDPEIVTDMAPATVGTLTFKGSPESDVDCAISRLHETMLSKVSGLSFELTALEKRMRGTDDENMEALAKLWEREPAATQEAERISECYVEQRAAADPILEQAWSAPEEAEPQEVPDLSPVLPPRPSRKEPNS